MAAKKNAAKKSTTKKTAAAKKSKRTRKPAPKFTQYTRNFTAAVIGEAVEKALADDNLGVKRQAANELSGKRVGMVARIVLDDGTRLVVTAQVK
jgi:hypothetical protein